VALYPPPLPATVSRTVVLDPHVWGPFLTVPAFFSVRSPMRLGCVQANLLDCVLSDPSKPAFGLSSESEARTSAFAHELTSSHVRHSLRPFHPPFFPRDVPARLAAPFSTPPLSCEITIFPYCFEPRPTQSPRCPRVLPRAHNSLDSLSSSSLLASFPASRLALFVVKGTVLVPLTIGILARHPAFSYLPLSFARMVRHRADGWRLRVSHV